MRVMWAVLALAVAVGGGSAVAAPNPAAIQELDALWALAPRDAMAGVVVSPPGVALVERAVVALQELLGSSVELAPYSSELMRTLLREVGTTNPTLARLGMTANQGLAVFIVDGAFVVALPVTDRDKFLAQFEGHHETGGDTLRGGLICRAIGARYVCASRHDLLGKLGAGGLEIARKTFSGRGDLELAARMSSDPDDVRVALAAQLDPGAFIAHGIVAGVRSAASAAFGTPRRPRADAATGSGFGVIDLTPYLARLPHAPIVAGLTVDALGRSISGPATFVIRPGTNDVGLRIPLRDPAPAQALVAHCAEIRSLGATVKDGTCHVSIPTLKLALDAWVDGNELRIGSRAPAAAATIVASPLATELARGEWSMAFYGRGSRDGATIGMPEPDGLMSKLIATELCGELGIGIRRDDNVLHFVVGGSGVWANPTDVIEKLLAIPPDQSGSGKALELERAIARAAPSSPFAQDLKAGPAGIVMAALGVGVVTAVAVPLLMDGLRRPTASPVRDKPEIFANLDHVSEAATRAYLEHGAFPIGQTPLTPAAPCCKGPNNHCVAPPAAWQVPVWNALQFAPDKPTLFQYAYRSDGKTFSFKAVGDLDCDGVPITWELRGSAVNGKPKIDRIPPANDD